MQRPPIQNFDAPQTAEQFDVSRCDRIADTDGPSAGSRAGGTDTAGRREYHNLALKGIVQASRHIGRHIISTALEHSSVGGALSALQQQGCEVDLVDIRRDGTIDLEQLR